jgi:hypothetical protein
MTTANRTPLSARFTPAQIERAAEMAQRAVGKQYKIRDVDGNVVHGVIDTCTPSHVGYRGRTAYVVFSVDMLCGATQRRRNFHITTVPQ